MQGQTGERWRSLCELAANEQDHEKLLELIQEINHLLSEKEHRLASSRKQHSGSAGSDGASADNAGKTGTR